MASKYTERLMQEYKLQKKFAMEKTAFNPMLLRGGLAKALWGGIRSLSQSGAKSLKDVGKEIAGGTKLMLSPKSLYHNTKESIKNPIGSFTATFGHKNRFSKDFLGKLEKVDHKLTSDWAGGAKKNLKTIGEMGWLGKGLTLGLGAPLAYGAVTSPYERFKEWKRGDIGALGAIGGVAGDIGSVAIGGPMMQAMTLGTAIPMASHAAGAIGDDLTGFKPKKTVEPYIANRSSTLTNQIKPYIPNADAALGQPAKQHI